MGYRVVPDEYGRPPHVSFDTPMDFVQYIDDIAAGKFAHMGITEVGRGSREQADEIRRNPKGWEMSGGHPKKKDDYLARNLPWIGPAAIGAAIAGPAIAGWAGSKGATAAGAKAGAAGGGAGGALPTNAALTNLGIHTGMRGAPTASMTTPASLLTGGGGGWRDALGGGAKRFLGGGGEGGMNAWQTAALAALAGLPALVAAKNSGMSDEEKAIYAQLQRDIEDQRQDRIPERALRDTQLRRINYQNPLFQAVSKLAMNRLPTNAQQPFGEF